MLAQPTRSHIYKNTKPHIVVDYDGVVLRGPRAAGMVVKNCESFVGRVTGNRILEHVRVLNQGLYKSFGHTVLGLRALGYNISVQEFNQHVYAGLDYSSMHEQQQQQHELDTLGLSKLVSAHPGRVHIFSNAPASWVVGTLGTTPAGQKLLDQINILEPDDPELLKPEPRAYIEVARKIALLDQGALQEEQHVYFVDDVLTNLEGAVHAGGWHGLWYVPHTLGAFRANPDIMCVKDLRDAMYYIALNEVQNHIT